MKKAVMEKWVAALRSDKYKQTKYRLIKTNGINREYCCLGVLCELASKEIELKMTLSEEKFPTSYKIEETCIDLPQKVLKWSGIKTLGGNYTTDTTDTTGRESLISLNDQGKSFKEIADVIEKNWRKL